MTTDTLDVVLALIVFEAAGLSGVLLATSRAKLLPPLLLFFLSGGLVFLAWRLDLSGAAGAQASLLALAGSGLSQLGFLVTAWHAVRR